MLMQHVEHYKGGFGAISCACPVQVVQGNTSTFDAVALQCQITVELRRLQLENGQV